MPALVPVPRKSSPTASIGLSYNRRGAVLTTYAHLRSGSVMIRLLIVFCACVILLAPSRAGAQSVGVTYRGITMLPSSTTDQNNASFTVGGVSGITYLGGNSFAAVM